MLTTSKSSLEHWFFLILCGIVLFVFWSIVQPFALVLLSATVAAVLLSPLDRKLVRLVKHQHFASILIVLGVLLIIFIPTMIAILLMTRQATELLQNTQLIDWLKNFHIQSLPFFSFLPPFIQEQIVAFDLGTLGRSAAEWTFKNFGSLFASTTGFILDTFLFFLALYYMLVDRKKLFKILVELSPFKDEMDTFLIARLIRTIRSVVFGVLLLGVAQGIVAGIGMTIFGVPGAILWGGLTIIASLIPFLGTALILIPAIIYLFVTGLMIQAIGLLIWSFVFVGLMDNVLGPYLIKGTTNMHAFLVLISILGGLQIFGPLGGIIGPTVLSALIALIELYKPGIIVEKQ